jgi:hypothetical protein
MSRDNPWAEGELKATPSGGVSIVEKFFMHIRGGRSKPRAGLFPVGKTGKNRFCSGFFMYR